MSFGTNQNEIAAYSEEELHYTIQGLVQYRKKMKPYERDREERKPINMSRTNCGLADNTIEHARSGAPLSPLMSCGRSADLTADSMFKLSLRPDEIMSEHLD